MLLLILGLHLVLHASVYQKNKGSAKLILDIFKDCRFIQHIHSMNVGMLGKEDPQINISQV